MVALTKREMDYALSILFKAKVKNQALEKTLGEEILRRELKRGHKKGVPLNAPKYDHKALKLLEK